MRKILIAWGMFSLIATIALFIFIVYGFHKAIASPSINNATTDDVKFVLNKSGLWNQRVEKVLFSVDEPTSFDGSYLQAYAFKISQINFEKFTKSNSEHSKNWYRGDRLPPLLNNVAKAVNDFRGYLNYDLSWLPNNSEITTANFYLYPLRVYLEDSIDSPENFQIILIRPADSMVFYLGYAAY